MNLRSALVGVLLICSGCAIGADDAEPAGKRIAITFDDAPRGDDALYTGAERTPRFIESLNSADIGPVVFFATTRGLSSADGRERIEAYAAAGHLIANHSDTHQWARRTEVADYLADIDTAEDKLGALNIDASQRRPWFRYPYLDDGRSVEKRAALRAGLKARDLMDGYVTVDTYDWYVNSAWTRAVRQGRAVDLGALENAYVDLIVGAANFYDDLAVAHMERQPAHVLLLHENDLAAEFIDELSASLRADGWEIISADEAYEDALGQYVPETLTTGSGPVAAYAFENGAEADIFDHLAISEEKIDAFLTQRNVFGPAPIAE